MGAKIDSKTPLADAAYQMGLALDYLVADVDELLRKIDRLLNFYQPPDSGKIRIYWWRKTKHGKTPVPVMWYRTGRRDVPWTAKKIGVKHLAMRASSRLRFKVHHRLIRELLRMAGDLLGIRHDAISSVRYFTNSKRAFRVNGASRVSDMRRGIDILNAKVEEDLRLAASEWADEQDVPDELDPNTTIFGDDE